MLATRAVHAKRRKVKESYGKRQHNGDGEVVVGCFGDDGQASKHQAQ